MNVLIISTNRYRKPVNVMPFGACIAAEAASGAGHDVRFLDLMFEKVISGAIRRELREFGPDVVGISVRNIDNNDLQQVEFFADGFAGIAKTIAAQSDAKIVIGGAAVCIMPEAMLRVSGADYCVFRDGEVVFPELLRALDEGRDARNVKGAGWIEDEVFREGEQDARHSGISNKDSRDIRDSKEIKDSSKRIDRRDYRNSLGGMNGFSCRTPDFGRWLDLRQYKMSMAAAPIQTKRGCPHQCVYCTYSLAEGADYRLAPAEGVCEEILRLRSQGFRDVEFVDNVFNSPYEHAAAICEALARQKTGMHFHTVEINPRFVNDELLTMMERAGFAGIGISAESASDPVLEGLNKGYTAEDLYRAAEAVARHRIPCLWMFMLGGPSETELTVRETIAFAERQIRPRDVAFFNVGIRVYPQTRLERRARQEGVLLAPEEEMLRPVFYWSPLVSLEWVLEELGRAVAAHDHFIGPVSINLPFMSALHKVSYYLGMRPPLWRHTRGIRKVLKVLGKKSG